MYGWIWHRLPGPTAARVGCALLLTATVIALLFFVIFPAVEPHLPFGEVTVAGH